MAKCYYGYDIEDENYMILVNSNGKNMLLDYVEFTKPGEDPKEITEKIVSEMNSMLKNMNVRANDEDSFAKILQGVYKKLGINRSYDNTNGGQSTQKNKNVVNTVKCYYEYDIEDKNYMILVNSNGEEMVLDFVESTKPGEDPEKLAKKIVSEMNSSLQTANIRTGDVDEFARILEKVYQKLGIDRPYTSEI